MQIDFKSFYTSFAHRPDACCKQMRVSLSVVLHVLDVKLFLKKKPERYLCQWISWHKMQLVNLCVDLG